MPLSLEDPAIRRRAAAAVERVGWDSLTLEQLAQALGVSRVTLHRQGIGKREVLAALGDHLVEAYQKAFWPVLTAPGTARDRMQQLCEALCELCEQNLALLDALSDSDRRALFHESGGEVLTRSELTGAFVRVLLDGVADGTLIVDGGAEESATVVFNLISWTYRHLRLGHGWPPERARRAVVGLAVRSVSR